MIIIISIGKILLRIIYFIFKLFPSGNKVVFLSRQSDSLSVDYSKIISGLKNSANETKIVTLIKRQEKDTKNFLASGIENAFFMIRQMWALATSKVAIVDGYSIPISILKHKKKLAIIQIWHAIGAIKKFGLQTMPMMNEQDARIAKALQMHEGYTYVISPSQACGEFFTKAFKVDSTQIKLFGTPHLDYLYYGENDKRDEILSEYPILNGKKVLLYAPTYRSGGDKDEFLQRIKNLRENIDYDKYALIVKLHPVDYSYFVIDARNNGHVYNALDKSITITDAFTAEDLLSVADCVISDYSSVAFDAGLLRLPIFFYVYDIEEYKENTGLNIDLEKEYERYSARNIEQIISMLYEEYDLDYMKDFIYKYISCYDGKCTERLVSFILSIVNVSK